MFLQKNRECYLNEFLCGTVECRLLTTWRCSVIVSITCIASSRVSGGGQRLGLIVARRLSESENTDRVPARTAGPHAA